MKEQTKNDLRGVAVDMLTYLAINLGAVAFLAIWLPCVIAALTWFTKDGAQLPWYLSPWITFPVTILGIWANIVVYRYSHSKDS